MATLTLVPRESTHSMISAIRNLVCPLCGGSMMGFRCLGHCCSDWQAEWELATSARSKSGTAAPKLRAKTVR